MPSRHLHSNLLSKSRHSSVPEGSHGPVLHSSFSISQVAVPTNPGLQVHSKESVVEVQVPPFLHGSPVQKSTSCWQLAPVNPGSQTQSYLKSLSTHIPRTQGSFSHKSTLVSHRFPENPVKQEVIEL